MASQKSAINKAFRILERNLLIRWFIFFLLILFVWRIRFRFVFEKVYAEDGALFLADTYRFNFPWDILEPAAGYSTLIMRIGGRFVSLFPLQYASIFFALFSALCLSFLAAGIFNYNNLGNKYKSSKLALALCFMFLPITSFSAIGNIANLYVYFMTASAVMLYHKEISRFQVLYKSLVLALAALSLPLSFFLVPILFHRSYLARKTEEIWRFQKSDFVFLVALLMQFVFILANTLGDRKPYAPQSVIKVAYLYLDRGIGSSVIPRFGFVSTNGDSTDFENSFLLFNSLTSRVLTVLGFLFFVIIVFIRNQKLDYSKIRLQFWFLISLGFIYSLTVGLFFNPEPRYMAFPAFITCWGLIMLAGVHNSHAVRRVFHFYLILVLALGLSSSDHRSLGPTWDSELQKAKRICLDQSPNYEIKIRTLPVDRNWEMVLKCKNLN